MRSSVMSSELLELAGRDRREDRAEHVSTAHATHHRPSSLPPRHVAQHLDAVRLRLHRVVTDAEGRQAPPRRHRPRKRSGPLHEPVGIAVRDRSVDHLVAPPLLRDRDTGGLEDPPVERHLGIDRQVLRGHRVHEIAIGGQRAPGGSAMKGGVGGRLRPRRRRDLVRRRRADTAPGRATPAHRRSSRRPSAPTCRAGHRATPVAERRRRRRGTPSPGSARRRA